MNEFGLANFIRTEHIRTGDANIHPYINNWLDENPDAEVIDIKFATSATSEKWGSDALIIYRTN